ncbi:hypothetical protein [Anaerorhabdus sp.]|uniref:hypothetical protein n=1 Tax=Anaerorhabdus sp. TaxID=1872524 RepID=UPI002FC973F7
MNRLIKKYNEFGKEGFIHGNRNRKPNSAFSDDINKRIIALYKNNGYIKANFGELS